MKPPQPSGLETQVLSLLWEHGPLTARAVLEQLPDEKPRAYTTVLSILQVMEKKGLVTHTTEGNRHIYAARVKKGAVLGPMLRDLLQTVFGGRPSSAMQQLLESTEVSEAEIADMRALLEEYKGRKGK